MRWRWHARGLLAVSFALEACVGLENLRNDSADAGDRDARVDAARPPHVDASAKAPDAGHIAPDAAAGKDARPADVTPPTLDATPPRDVAPTMDATPPNDATDFADAADACPSFSPLDDDASTPAVAADGGGLLPGPPATQCTPEGPAPPTTINWLNLSCVPVEAWWVEVDCTESYYEDVPAKGTVAQPTYVGQVWRLREVGTHILLRDIPPNPSAAATTYTFP